MRSGLAAIGLSTTPLVDPTFVRFVTGEVHRSAKIGTVPSEISDSCRE